MEDRENALKALQFSSVVFLSSEYYQQVGTALETTGPACRVEVDNATKTMYDWWGQPAKREEMNVIFR